MIRKIVRQIARRLGPVRPFSDALPDSSDFDHAVPASQREIVKRLALIPYWEDKIKHFDQYEYFQAEGIWRAKGDTHHSGEGGAKFIEVSDGELFNVNYGCGPHLIEGWLNIDNYESTEANYHRLNLLDKHPFRENSVRFGFSEDFLEHLNQAESIFFLCEVYRTLAPGGVLRLSFPGLEGVLAKHYSPPTERRVREAEFEAYSFWDHLHFYSKDELSLVARHIGFKRVDFVDYGASQFAELCNRDTRSHQIGLNTYAELVK
jgi:predicted SAM-dependent methyltransferase